MNDETIHSLKGFLEHPKNIIVIPHRNPDGDAVGSSLAVYHWLNQRKHTVHLLAPNDFPDFLKWMPGADRFTFFENDQETSRGLLHKADLIFTLDFNAISRLGGLGQALSSYSGPYVMIDHHQMPESYATWSFSDPKMGSTCEMVYNLITAMGDAALIDSKIAQCLYTGIMTDTGSFRFPSTTPATHRVIADLMDKGAQHWKIHEQVYDANSVEKLQLLGQTLKNLTVLPEYRTAFMSLTADELERHHFRKGDTEGFVNYGLSLKDIILSVIFIENSQEGIIKISLRSKGHFSVNDLARKHFEGGGHINAAGGKSVNSLEDTIEYFKALLPEYQTQLENS